MVAVLVVAAEEKQRSLAEALAAEFEVERAADAGEALEFLARRDVDALLFHLDLGETAALELLGQLKRRAAGRMPGIVLVARTLDVRTAVAVVRAGAFDILPEESLKPRELAHLLRNAAFHAQAVARLGERRAPQSKEVLVIGTGDAVDAAVLMLEASGLTVRRLARMPEAGGLESSPRAIVVDLSAVGDGEALLGLLAPG